MSIFGLGIAAWLTAHLHSKRPSQHDLTEALKVAHARNADAIAGFVASAQQAIAASAAEAAQPRHVAQKLLCQIHKRRGRVEKPH